MSQLVPYHLCLFRHLRLNSRSSFTLSLRPHAHAKTLDSLLFLLHLDGFQRYILMRETPSYHHQPVQRTNVLSTEAARGLLLIAVKTIVRLSTPVSSPSAILIT